MESHSLETFKFIIRAQLVMEINLVPVNRADEANRGFTTGTCIPILFSFPDREILMLSQTRWRLIYTQKAPFDIFVVMHRVFIWHQCHPPAAILQTLSFEIPIGEPRHDTDFLPTHSLIQWEALPSWSISFPDCNFHVLLMISLIFLNKKHGSLFDHLTTWSVYVMAIAFNPFNFVSEKLWLFCQFWRLWRQCVFIVFDILTLEHDWSQTFWEIPAWGLNWIWILPPPLLASNTHQEAT